MRRERKVKKADYLTRLAVGPKVEAALDRQIDMLSLTCDSSGFSARMHIGGQVEAEYYKHSGTLIMGAWMAVEVKCSAEQAAELAKAIGSAALPSFEIIG
ncbi:hypothetical protein [Paraburkholderia sp. BL10I2N1]|uniref:hypothetical protein n=1 Tax=Paraburkholderia sp. BL10I2N1 TaxID=1938796 RepID=UPI00105F9256|nr:hypothetical protein [Paraburkholderia sp. BL10I2N1]TDN62433.1 hypothetical protein B0G77_6006 [Paraburkholderia sp. BL10I2N1]